MEKAAKKINKKDILNIIKEEAEFLVKKDEYLNKVKDLNEEIKNLYENRGFVGTFGFQGDDAQKSKSGFVNPQSISYIAQLEKEFGVQEEKAAEKEETLNEDELNEITQLKKENENLKQQIEEISAFIKTMKADQDK
jgi:hypothetical protein